MENLRAIQLDPVGASAALQRPAPPRDAVKLLRSRLLDTGLDAQGVLALADAILALQRTRYRS